MAYPKYQKVWEKTKITLLKDKFNELCFSAVWSDCRLIDLTDYVVSFNVYSKDWLYLLQLIKNWTWDSLTWNPNQILITNDNLINGRVCFTLTKNDTVNNYECLIWCLCYDVIATKKTTPFGDAICLAWWEICFTDLKC